MVASAIGVDLLVCHGEGAEMKGRFCDRCKQPIYTWNELLQEKIDQEYTGKDICPNCDVDIKMAEAIARQASISGKSQLEVAKEWLKQYE